LSTLLSLNGLSSVPADSVLRRSRDELLLAADAVDVAVRQALALRTKASACEPLIVCRPPRGRCRSPSPWPARQAHLDAAEGVHHRLEAVEVDLHVVVDAQPDSSSIVRMSSDGPPFSNAEFSLASCARRARRSRGACRSGSSPTSRAGS
jgi:hypothetical protein